MMNEYRKFWDDRYTAAGEEFVFGTEPSQFLVRHAKRLEGCRKVLAVADGEGRNSVWLAARGFEVTATEISPVAIAKARKFAAAAGTRVDFVEADVTDWNWPESAFDAVVGIFIQFVDPAARGPLFADMCKALRPGGLLLLHGYTPKQLEYRTGGPSAVENLYTEAMLASAFSAMERVEIHAYETDLSEGRGHSGRSAVIDLVARRPAA